MKGKPVFVIIGVVGLLAIATKPKKESNDIVRELSAQIIIKVWPVIGAIRLAKPNSTWARRYYGSEKMQLAHMRFPKGR